MYVYDIMYWGKTTSNTNTLNADEINVDNLNAINIDSVNIDSNTVNSTIANFSDITVDNSANFNDISVENEAVFEDGVITGLGLSPFVYKRGTWTPTFTYVNSTGIKPPVATITYTNQFGYYVKTGANVQVWFDVEFSTVGGDAYVGGSRFPVIGGLPFKIGNYSTSDYVYSSATLTKSSFPNGMGGDLVPALSSPVYPGPFVVNAYEEGFDVPLFINVIVSISAGEWTADGYHLTISTPSNLYGADLAIPPWTLVSSTVTPLSNFHITSDLITYPGCRFAGSISYFTDE